MKKRKQKLQNYLKIVIFIQLVLLLFFEAIRIVQEFQIDDVKALSAILSGLLGYLISSIFQEIRKLKNK
jgi:glycopeptide antibiotics resistance protein